VASSINQAQILFVDDEASILQALRRVMRTLSANCHFANSGQEALALMEDQPIDVVVSDMKMPSMDGAEFLAKVAELYPETVRMILSGYSDGDSVLSAINDGRIWGYINKPWDAAQLIQTIEHAINTQQMIAERALLKRSLEQYQTYIKDQFEGFIGTSVSMQFIYSAIERAAPSNASVFITGSSGTGKEVAAQALHNLSKRSTEPFIAINCAAIPSELMESEIFGHLKGAFSGAVSHRDGAAALADGGTLFLDEIGEMDILLQAKLLRFIQTGTYQKVGSNKVEKVDIRFICATNRDPLLAISEKKLREDLYYRLNVISIHLPDLKDREQDSVLLAQYFLQHYVRKEDAVVVGFSKDAEAFIAQYSWPGNVRQLENAVQSAVVMAQGPLISLDDMKMAMGITGDVEAGQRVVQQEVIESSATTTHNASEIHSSKIAASDDMSDIAQGVSPLHEVERLTIENAVNACDGNVVKAAALLEVSPSTLYRKIQSWKDQA